MLKTVATEDLKLGMFVHAISGAWINHPFWKQAFVLKSLEDLQKLQSSAVKAVVIDTNKGLDFFTCNDKQHTVLLEKSHAALDCAAMLGLRVPKAHISTFAEMTHAKKLLQSSKSAVKLMFNEVRMGKALNLASTMLLVDEIATSIERNNHAFISLARLKHKDDYTYMHSIAVCGLMVALAKELRLSDEETKQAGLAGLLHDIGKMRVPLAILNKPSALTNEEFSMVKTHSEQGYALLQKANVTVPMILDVCLHHHEKIDGTGYPSHAREGEISLYAKMAAVCDVYDAVTSNRPYKAGWEPGISLQRMATWEGHFDAKVFKAFVKSVGIYPVGSMVKLQSGRLGVVIEQNHQALLTPVVKVFFSIKANCRIPYAIIDLAKKQHQDVIVSNEDPLLWGIHDVNAIWAADS